MRVPQVVVAVIATVTLVVAPGAAFAARQGHVDPARDVRMFWAPDVSGAGTARPTRTEGDVRVIRVKHGPRRVRVRLSLDLLRHGGYGATFYFRVRTPQGGKRVYVSAYYGNWLGRQDLSTAGGGRWSCSGLTHTIDYSRNRVSVAIPRSCLGNPRWVQVGAASVTYDMDSNLYVDDARSTRVGTNVVLGPRVAKG